MTIQAPIDKLRRLRELQERDRIETAQRARADYPTPGALAQKLDPMTVQTPALEIIDAELVQIRDSIAVMFARRARFAALVREGVDQEEATERAAAEIPSEGNDRLIISMPPQEGKGLDLETAIATPDGWTAMGELEVGDAVFGADGKPCRVTAAYEPRELDCYRITFQNLSSLIADGDHLWRVQDRNGSARGDRARRPWIVVNTRELARDPVRYGVPVQMPLELPDRNDLLVDPYVLGAWLGDGHSTGAMITSDDQEIIENIRAAGVPCRKAKAKYAYSLAPAIRGYGQASPIRRALVELGVFGNKHIPIRYLRASEKQRLELLQGLMDTDGSVYANESGYSRCEFTGTSERLTADVLTLTRSLGIHSAVHESRATIDGRDVGPRWRVRFTTDLPVFRLSRKAARLYGSPGPRKARHKNGIRSVELIASRPTRCIEVNSADQTFLAGEGLIPTHNSSRVTRYGVLWLLKQFPTLRVGIVSYDGDNAAQFSYLIRADIELFDGTGNNVDLAMRLAKDQKAMSRWMLNTGGSVYAIGIGGGLAGRPVDALLIDDPTKDIRAADSLLLSSQAWEWWQTVARPRLAPWAPVIEVSTRWHEADLAGRMLAKQAEDEAAGLAHFDRWRAINIPAQAEDDDLLGRAPGEFMVSARGRTLAQWEATKAATAPRFWTALYQGKPTPDVGDIWLREWWRRYDTVLWTQREDGTYRLDGYDVTQSWDCAFRDTKSSDFVVGQVWAKKGADSFLIYQVWARLSFTNTIEAIRRVTRLFPQGRRKIIEAKANGDAVIDSLKHEISGIIAAEPTQSKTARATAVSPFIRAGNVHLPTTRVATAQSEIAFDVEAFIHQATAFPNAANDDAVDAASQYLNELYIIGGEATFSVPEGLIPRNRGRSDKMPRVNAPAMSPIMKRLTDRQLTRPGGP